MSLNGVGLTEAIKRAALGAYRAEKPVEVCYGKVTKAKPLEILVEQKMTLGTNQLVLTRNVTDFKTQVTVNWATNYQSGGSGDSAFASHSHGITGKKEITVHNGLAVGDEVILLREQGGQKYIVLDRIGKGYLEITTF